MQKSGKLSLIRCPLGAAQIKKPDAEVRLQMTKYFATVNAEGLRLAVDVLRAVGTHAYHGDGTTAFALDEFDIFSGVFGQQVKRLAGGDVLVPSGELLVNRFASDRKSNRVRQVDN